MSREPEQHEREREQEEAPPAACPACGVPLVASGGPGALRALGWWLVAMAPILLVVGLTLGRDDYFLAAGAALLAGAVLCGLPDLYACDRCGKRYPWEPEGRGREVDAEHGSVDETVR